MAESLWSLTINNYLGNSILEIKYHSASLKAKDIYDGLVKAFEKIASHVSSLKQDFEGSREFLAKPINVVVKDKKIHLSKIDESGGRGESQNENQNSAYQVDLLNEDWYVYNDNYGTDQEKLMVKYFINNIKPELDEKGLTYYLIRNERFPELAIYSFADGERFEPDFILLIEKTNVSNNSKYQIYIEPKGSHLLIKDKWKEDLLLEIEALHYIPEKILTLNDEYLIVGLPFFNDPETIDNFMYSFNSLIDKL